MGIYKYTPSVAGSRRRHGGWSAPTGWLEEAAHRSAAAIASGVSKNLRSGARAFRKYECNAMQKWVTMHVSQTVKQMKGARDGSL
eukprot:6190472-Pleurochrysis_carterae.AAC.1